VALVPAFGEPLVIAAVGSLGFATAPKYMIWYAAVRTIFLSPCVCVKDAVKRPRPAVEIVKELGDRYFHPWLF